MFGKMLPLLLLFYKHVFPSPTPFSSSPLWVKVMPAAIPRSVVAKSFCLLSEPSSRWLHTMNPWEEVRRQFVPTQVSLSHFACSSLEFCQFYLCWKSKKSWGHLKLLLKPQGSYFVSFRVGNALWNLWFHVELKMQILVDKWDAKKIFFLFVLQGVSFEILRFEMTVALNWWGSDPKLVKPKSVWEVAVFCAKSNFFQKI